MSRRRDVRAIVRDAVAAALKSGAEAPEKLGAECFTVGWEFTDPDKTYRRTTANPEGDENDRGLRAIYADVKKFMGNRTVLKAEAARLDGVIEKMKLKAAKAEVNSTIATNIEH